MTTEATRIAAGLLFAAVTMLLMAAAACSAGSNEPRRRAPAVSGVFYPADEESLKSAVLAALDKASIEDAKRDEVLALIVPHAGYVYSGETAGHAFAAVRGAAFKRVVVIGVSHYASPAPVWIDDADFYRTPLGDVPVDSSAAAKLAEEGIQVIADAAPREHSIEVEIPFLQVSLEPGWALLPVLIGRAGLQDLSAAAGKLRDVLDDDTLVVVSTDFTHYGADFSYTPFEGGASEIREAIKTLDDDAIRPILARDAKGFNEFQRRTGATICGRGAVMALLEMLPDTADGELAFYTTSGEKTGDFSSSVSYAAIIFRAASGGPGIWHDRQAEREDEMSDEGLLTAQEKDTLLALARKALTARVLENSEFDAGELTLTESLKEKRGAFVTLEKDGRLRGCIGYVDALKPLWQTVAENAVNAGLNDPRFPPVTPDELPRIHIEISAMTPLETIDDASVIEVGKHGIMLSQGYYRGLLLPQVATEYGWDREEFLTHTCRKAGLDDDAWKDPKTQIEIFSAEVFGEEEPK